MSYLAALSNAPPPRKWHYFRGRFDAFLENLDPTPPQISDGVTSVKGVLGALNAHYWGSPHETANAWLSGGWGKGLWVRPPRDIDLLFVLPEAVYHRFELRTGNRQSDLLQEVKGVIGAKYKQTDLRGDGQVVIVPFTHVTIEVAPAFALENGRLLICDTTGGGAYQETDIAAEIGALDWAAKRYNGCARPLIRMAKQWQRHCNVGLRSYQLERLVIGYLAQAPASYIHYRWWDWLLRDFFAFLCARANGIVIMPGTMKWVFLGDAWLSKAQTACRRAVLACDYEIENEDYLAGATWQDVFGAMIPQSGGWGVL